MTTEAKATISAVEYNVRLWKTENGWKVTTTSIEGVSRDVTSKLRPNMQHAALIAQQFFHEAIANEAGKEFRSIGEVVAQMDLPMEAAPEEDTTPEEIVDAINASMLANDRKRGFKG